MTTRNLFAAGCRLLAIYFALESLTKVKIFISAVIFSGQSDEPFQFYVMTSLFVDLVLTGIVVWVLFSKWEMLAARLADDSSPFVNIKLTELVFLGIGLYLAVTALIEVADYFVRYVYFRDKQIEHIISFSKPTPEVSELIYQMIRGAIGTFLIFNARWFGYRFDKKDADLISHLPSTKAADRQTKTQE